MNKGKQLSEKLQLAFHAQNTVYPLKIDDTYTVYGMKLWDGNLSYLIVDMYGEKPFWFPARIFEVSNHVTHLEWYFNFYGDINGLNAIWGYKELLDLKHYDGLIEREPEDMAIFAKRRQEIDEYEELSKYIPKIAAANTNTVAPVSRVYTETPVDQSPAPDTLLKFLGKYLDDRVSTQKFATMFCDFYSPVIDYNSLRGQASSCMNRLRTTTDNYSPFRDNPNRDFSTEDDVKEAAEQAFQIILADPQLSALRSKR